MGITKQAMLKTAFLRTTNTSWSENNNILFSVLTNGRFPDLRIITQKQPSQFLSDQSYNSNLNAFMLPEYGDEIAQDSHLFPFYPQRNDKFILWISKPAAPFIY